MSSGSSKSLRSTNNQGCFQLLSVVAIAEQRAGTKALHSSQTFVLLEEHGVQTWDNDSSLNFARMQKFIS